MSSTPLRRSSIAAAMPPKPAPTTTAETVLLMAANHTPDSMLTLDPEELRRLALRVVDLLVDHAEHGAERPPLLTATPAELRERVGGPPPEGRGDPDAALDVLVEHVLPYMQHGDHPRFFARVPSPSNPVSVLADMPPPAMNVICASWVGGSGPAAVELAVLEWLCAWTGLPPETEGVLVSGGSVGSLTALAAAREAC